jgi:hypothetical protein
MSAQEERRKLKRGKQNVLLVVDTIARYPAVITDTWMQRICVQIKLTTIINWCDEIGRIVLDLMHDPIHRYDLSKEALIKTSKQRLDKSCPSNEYMRHIPPSKKGGTPTHRCSRAQKQRDIDKALSFSLSPPLYLKLAIYDPPMPPKPFHTNTTIYAP